MFHRKSDEEGNNFWISYADLMAGLLFLFILLIGAIVSKSIIMREDLRHKRMELSHALSELEKNRDNLKEKERALEERTRRLARLKRELRKREEALASGNSTIERQSVTIEKQKEEISQAREKIRLQEEEVRKLHELLAELKKGLEKEHHAFVKLEEERGRLQNTLDENRKKLEEERRRNRELITLEKNELRLKEDELERLNQLLLAKNTKIDELNKKVVILQNLENESNVTLEEKQKKIQKYANRVLVLSGKLTKKEQELRLKDEKLAEILDALDKEKTKYDDMIESLRAKRAKIRRLTGVRLKVIAALKETLGSKMGIDRDSGALRFDSSILFDKGSAELKEGAKKELRKIFEEYIAALMSSRAIRPHLERIVIEGHTDSDGDYLYNLRLSQRRALAVMSYLLTLPISQEYNLKNYLLASGRAYQDPIMRNGVEDKKASRRIEIKFRLKNRDAMEEIERILDEEKIN
jgi:chemotaxis protein MotB